MDSGSFSKDVPASLTLEEKLGSTAGSHLAPWRGFPACQSQNADVGVLAER